MTLTKELLPTLSVIPDASQTPLSPGTVVAEINLCSTPTFGASYPVYTTSFVTHSYSLIKTSKDCLPSTSYAEPPSSAPTNMFPDILVVPPPIYPVAGSSYVSDVPVAPPPTSPSNSYSDVPVADSPDDSVLMSLPSFNESPVPSSAMSGVSADPSAGPSVVHEPAVIVNTSFHHLQDGPTTTRETVDSNESGNRDFNELTIFNYIINLSSVHNSTVFSDIDNLPINFANRYSSNEFMFHLYFII